MRDPDGELVERARQGDAKAMQLLYQSHVGAIHGYALRCSGRPHLADEIAQETFVRAFRSIGSFQGRAQFKTWLRSIAVNCTRSQLDHDRRRPTEELKEDTAWQEAPEARSWTQRRLERALALLPEGYREVVLMHDLLGLQHNEIAELRGCSVGTSKSQLHKGRAKLRLALEAIDADE